MDTTETEMTKTFRIGGKLEVSRMGYGAMRLTGQPGNFGRYPDWEGGKRLLQRAAELGVNFFDTALPYGPGASEQILAEALADRPVVIATKGGVDKPAPGQIVTDGRPATLRAHVDRSLSNLGRETIDLYQLHRVDPAVPLADSVGALAEMRKEGKLRFVGLSNVTLTQYEEARAVTSIESVQNRLNLAERGAMDLVAATARDGAAFIPYGPLGARPMEAGAPLADKTAPLASIARELGIKPGQLALSWLLHTAPNTIVIPATTSIAHLEENVAALGLDLPSDVMKTLEQSHEEDR